MQTETPTLERDVVSWDDLERLIAALTERLANERFDLMLAITRGGLVPAGMLAYRLHTRHWRRAAQSRGPSIGSNGSKASVRSATASRPRADTCPAPGPSPATVRQPWSAS